jgi:hypothetical protein
MQTYIGQHGQNSKTHQGKGVFPKCQVTSWNYFCMPSARGFGNIFAEIRESVVMGFTDNPEHKSMGQAMRDLPMDCTFIIWITTD